MTPRGRMRSIATIIVMLLSCGLPMLAGAQAETGSGSEADSAPRSGLFALAANLPAADGTPQLKVNPGAAPGRLSLPPELRPLGARLARAAVIAVGAYPISLLYTNFGFDVGTFIAHSGDSRYAPWPFKSASSINPDTGEKSLRLAVAAAVSLALGALDALLERPLVAGRK